jgi:hypothetical protein
LIKIARPMYADEDIGLRLKRAIYIFGSASRCWHTFLTLVIVQGRC